MISTKLLGKLDDLEKILKMHSRLCVSFSGGIDSTFLVYFANKVLGSDMVAVTVNTSCMIDGELRFARTFCKSRGIKHAILPVNMLNYDEFVRNDPKRCFYCKTIIFESLNEYAQENGYDFAADGTNLDDISKDRPGLAALTNEGIISPLLMAEFTTQDVLDAANYFDVLGKDQESNSCLATRVATGETITMERLKKVSRAEAWLKARGFKKIRVKTSEKQDSENQSGIIQARIIVAEDQEHLLEGELLDQAREYFAEIGLELIKQ